MPKLTNRGPAGLLKKLGNGKAKPKLTNRGPAGLLKKQKHEEVPLEKIRAARIEGKINNIPPGLRDKVVLIESLTPDPVNARVHPERNIEAIKDSLRLYGQMKPLVVRKKGRTVVAGNGTLEAAKQLGWTKIAVTMVDLNDVEAAGYGLADNRSAELARWDFEVVARIDKLLQQAKQNPVGWSMDELEVLRMADWSPPELDGDDSTYEKPLVLSLSPDEQAIILKAVKFWKSLHPSSKDLSDGACLSSLAKDWMRIKKVNSQ